MVVEMRIRRNRGFAQPAEIREMQCGGELGRAPLRGRFPGDDGLADRGVRERARVGAGTRARA